VDNDEADQLLFLEDHADLPHHFEANSFNPTWRANFEGVIPPSGAVSIFEYPQISTRAEELGFEIVFLDDPSEGFEWVANLVQAPEVVVNSDLPGTINGLLPFQVQGFNFLKDLAAGFANWSTGTGKTALGVAQTLYHRDFDLTVWVVKTHNKINTARTLERLGGIKPIVVDGTKAQRQEIYETIDLFIEHHLVVVTNYEKLRDDKEAWIRLVTDRRVLVLFDEMPTKLRNRDTKIYKACAEIFYTSRTGRNVPVPRAGAERPSEFRSLMLSATPIENSPYDLFNTLRLLSPASMGSIKKFEDRHVIKRRVQTQSKNPRFRYIDIVVGYQRLDEFAAQIAHMVHQVDKRDPDIATQFPKVMDETIYIDLTDRDRKLYDRLLAEYMKLMNDELSALHENELLAAIGVFQMLCDNPLMVLESAKRREEWDNDRCQMMDTLDCGPTHKAMKVWEKENPPEGSEVAWKLCDIIGDGSLFTDTNKAGDEPTAAKLEVLREILEGHDEKALVFTTFNQTGLPHLVKWLDRWNIDHVVYHGGLTQKQKQEAKDRFRDDPDCKVFLSSDAGSDSLNLEVANLVVHYNLPFKWSTFEQRQNRAHRLTSDFEHVQFYTLAVVNSIEDRKREILDKKYGYHQAILKGEIADLSEALRSKGDLVYVLTGERQEPSE
jgi:SNF2 family DNA or RNA helicase